MSTNARPSRRAHSRPTVVLPAPIRPIRTRCPCLIANDARVRVVVAHELLERVAAELAQRLGREHERDHRLGDDTGGGDRGDVGALLERDGRFLGLDVDGLEHGTVQRRERLHRDAGDEQVAGRHPAFDAARARRLPPVLTRLARPR